MKSNQLKLIFISCILIITSVFFYSVKAVDAEDTDNSDSTGGAFSNQTRFPWQLP